MAAEPGGYLSALLESCAAPAAWVASPYLRTQQTAAVLRRELARHGGGAGAAAAGAPTLVCPLLHERLYPNVSFGSYTQPGWTGFTQDERERFERAEEHAGTYFYRSPGAENCLDVGERAERLLRWLERAGLGAADTVVLVSHASAISDMATWLLDTPPHVAERAGGIANCGVVVLLRAEAGAPPAPAGAPTPRYTLDPACDFARRLARGAAVAAWGGPAWVADSLRALGYALPQGAGGRADAKAAARAAAARALASLPPAAHAQQSAEACARLRALPQWQAARTVALYLPLRPSGGAGSGGSGGAGSGGSGGAQECNVEPLVEAALREGKRVLLPRVLGPRAQDMTMLHVHSWEEVVSWAPVGRWGLREPPLEVGGGGGSGGGGAGGGGAGGGAAEGAGAAAPALPLLRADWHACLPDLVLLPGVAFDAACTRLGHGKGYYDAWLAALEGVCGRRGLAMPYLVAAALAPQMLPQGEALPRDPWDWPLKCVVGPTHTFAPAAAGSS